MDKLPNDILENILFRLPMKPALQARRVCRTWRNLLANRRYEGFLLAHEHGRLSNKEIQLYLGEQYDHIHVDRMNYYYSNEELIKLKHGSLGWDLYKGGMCILVGSCNGLVCFRIRNERFLIWNPLTGEAVLLPATADYPCTSKGYGFGYCHSSDNYKVVRMHTRRRKKGLHVQVCTIGSGWRNIVSIPNNLPGPGIFVNGLLHWLDYNDNGGCKTVTFDLEDEKFRSLPKPPSEVQYFSCGNTFGLLGANFYLLHIDVENCTNIWVYKRNNNNSSALYDMKGHDQKSSDYYNSNSWNWIKEFSVKNGKEHFGEPFAITKSNQVLFWCGRNILSCYDPVTSTFNKLWDDNGIEFSEAVAIPHTISFISLKEIAENGAGDCKYITEWSSKDPKENQLNQAVYQTGRHVKRRTMF